MNSKTKLSSPAVSIVVTPTEFEAVAEKIRPHTETVMKIEVAPWLKDYVVDTKELYTDVELEKKGEETVLMNDYGELFEIENVIKRIEFEPEVQVKEGHRNPLLSDENSKSFSNKIFCCFNRESEAKPELSAEGEKGQRVLLKGDPGRGKTMLCRKITLDWSKKVFTKFCIVFLVFLKLVKSGASIESIIMEQNPFLNSVKVTQSKLKSMLETFGSCCLVIFDGLDEHDIGTNADLVAIMKGEKYPNLNVIVTARPQAVRKMEIYFPLVVRVRGFTPAKAREFASKILPNKEKIKTVMHFSPVDFKGHHSIHRSPILLSFLCLLIKEDDIDLTEKTIHTGEIYLRMIRCLYERFLKRKGRQFEQNSFIKVMVSMGKLAFETLLSGNPLLEKSEVLQEVGDDAFDYGLLIGHENAHTSTRNEVAGTLVTFADRSIQEFLAAFYFIWMLNQKHTINSLLGDDADNIILMKEPLFLKFCLWFLRRKQKHITLRNGSIIYGHLKDFCVRCIKSMHLDLAEITEAFPALDPTVADASKDELHIKFIAHIFKMCNRRKCIIM